VSLQRAIILDGLQQLSNATQFGRDGCVTFEANRHEHWLQCTPTQIKMDWPFASPPAENQKLKLCFGKSVHIGAWEPDAFVMLIPAIQEVDSLVAGIDSVFQDLYGLDADYALTYKVEDANKP
jgi:hypothetical protein